MADEKPESPLGTTGKMAYGSNIWGWRFSFLGLALILFMIGVMAIRYAMLFNITSPDLPPGHTSSIDSTEQEK